MKPEIIDNVNKPNHYQGRFGMESIDALRNFMTPEQRSLSIEMGQGRLH